MGDPVKIKKRIKNEAIRFKKIAKYKIGIEIAEQQLLHVKIEFMVGTGFIMKLYIYFIKKCKL